MVPGLEDLKTRFELLEVPGGYIGFLKEPQSNFAPTILIRFRNGFPATETSAGTTGMTVNILLDRLCLTYWTWKEGGMGQGWIANGEAYHFIHKLYVTTLFGAMTHFQTEFAPQQLVNAVFGPKPTEFT